MSDEISEGGSKFIQHTNPVNPQLTPPDMSSSSMEAISRHITEHVGDPSNVFHEVVSDIVHIDVHIVAPTADRPYYTLITTGMSDLPMSAPERFSQFRYSELLLCLPVSWPMGNDAFKKEDNYWPIRGLKWLARFPHTYKTWLWWGHTVPNGNPAEPFASNFAADGWLVAHPKTVSKDFLTLKIDEEKTIHFHCLLPVYADEMKLKLEKGTEELLKRFERAKYSEIINTSRKSVAAKPWWNPF